MKKLSKKAMAWEASGWLIYGVILLIVIISLIYLLSNYGEEIWTKISSFLP